MNIKEQAIAAATKCYKPEYLGRLTEEEKMIAGMSRLISQMFDYDGMAVLEICKKALTDCNCHQDAREIQTMIDQNQD